MEGSVRNQILKFLKKGIDSEKSLFDKFRLPIDIYFEILKITQKQNLIELNVQAIPNQLDSKFIYPNIKLDIALTELGEEYVQRVLIDKNTDFVPDTLDYFQFRKSGVLLSAFEKIPYSTFKEKYLNMALSSRIDIRILYYILTGIFIEENKIENKEQIKWTLNWLEPYSSAHKSYIKALELFDNSQFERVLLEELRFTLEQFLKQYLSNEKPLEKQGKEIKERFKEENVNSHVSGFYEDVFKRFYLYQNDCVKHNEKYTQLEMEFMIELTTALMKLLLKIKHNNG